MRVYAIAMAAYLALSGSNPAYSQDRTFGDFDCTDDCSGHAAGYEWANRHSVDTEDNCPYGNSQSFHEGCIAYTQDPFRGAEEDDQSNSVGEPIEKSDSDDE